MWVPYVPLTNYWRYIGLTLPAAPAAWLPVAGKLALLDAAMEELLAAPDIWIPELRSVIAQFVHYALLRSTALSCLNALFKFAQHEWGERRPWWHTAWKEDGKSERATWCILVSAVL